MHNPGAEGNDYFVCDFCRRHWADDRPMVEGHKGSLICGQCLTPAYVEIVQLLQGTTLAGTHCTMCLEHRNEPQWSSPLFPESHICRRCLKQAAGVLCRDPESGWHKPQPPAGVSPAHDDEDDIDDDVV